MTKRTLCTLAAATLLGACNPSDMDGDSTRATLQAYSNIQPLVSMFPAFSGVQVFPLLSSSDTIAGSPGFVYGGAPDGQGFLRNPDGSGYIMITNHENTFAVSRVYLDRNLKPTRGEYIVNTDGGMFRLCSGSLATPEKHGFPKPVFLSTGESNVNAMTHAIDPIGAADPSNNARVKPALGKFSGENAVPLAKDAYPGKTVVILGEDAGNGQVYLYMSNTPGDLDNGTLYVLRRKDGNQVETAMTKGNTYEVEFVAVPNAKNLTGAEIEGLNSTLGSIQFARVEDLDYRKGGGANSRDLFFVATGVANQPEKTYWGRVYNLRLDAGNPLSGKLSIIADGADDGGKDIINPDNLCATENYLYIQEDGDSFFPGATHDSWIWQYSFATGKKVPFMDMRNRQLAGTPFNPTRDQRFGLWEHGAMVDISDAVGVPGTFTINVHAHSWVDGDRFLNPSKASSVQPYKAGGQTLIVTNVPR